MQKSIKKLDGSTRVDSARTKPLSPRTDTVSTEINGSVSPSSEEDLKINKIKSLSSSPVNKICSMNGPKATEIDELVPNGQNETEVDTENDDSNDEESDSKSVSYISIS